MKMEEPGIPHEVVGMVTLQDLDMIRAWREHSGLRQADVAGKMSVTSAAYAQTEKKRVRPRIATLKKIAKAMGITWEQLQE